MDQVEEIKDKIDIVDFINARVPLKKAGRNYRALCPFHQEKTPSFFVNPERQIWYCFGACDEGGDIISFLQKWEALEFSEALKILAEEAGVKLTYRGLGSEKARKKQKLYEINHLAAEYYSYLLTEHPVGETARAYLKKRGLKKKTTETFKLGYGPKSWDALTKYLVKKKYSPELVEEAGLALFSSKGRSLYDRFRGRIIFPMRDHRGNIVGFSGRTLQEDAKQAKYINSPETLIYHKRETLYGLDITGKAIRREGSAILVEGEFDVLSSFQEGISNLVAVKGSGLTTDQLRLLKRYTGKIVFALDADKAGEKAIRRGVLMADDEGLDVRVIVLQDGKDPDEIIHKDPALWRKLVKKPVVYFDYIIDATVDKYGAETAHAKRRIVEKLAEFFARSTNPIVRAHYTKQLATKLELSEEIVSQSLESAEKKIKLPRISVPESSSKQNLPRWQLLEEYLLSLVIQSEKPARDLKVVEEVISLDKMPVSAASKVLNKLKQSLREKKDLNITKFIESLDKELLSVADKAYLRELSALENTQKRLKELKNAARELRLLVLRDELKQATAELRQLEQSGDEKEKLKKLNKKVAELSRKIHSSASIKRAGMI